MISTASEVQTCLNCAELEAQHEKDMERLARELHYVEDEKEQALERIQQLEFHNRRLEAEVHRLATKGEEPIGKRKQKESDEIKEWLEAWATYLVKIPHARKPQDRTRGPESSNAKFVRIARRVWKHEEMMAQIHGAGLSDWHMAESGRFKVSTLIGGDRRDEKIQAHISRYEAAENLRKAGFTDEVFIRAQVQNPKQYEKLATACPDCGGGLWTGPGGCRCGP